MELVSQKDKWRVQEVARLASEYCTKYLIEYIRNHSGPSKIARSLGRFSRNDDQIIAKVMEAIEQIRPLDEEFEILEFNWVIRRVLDVLHELERFQTEKLLVEELKRAGYIKKT